MYPTYMYIHTRTRIDMYPTYIHTCTYTYTHVRYMRIRVYACAVHAELMVSLYYEMGPASCAALVGQLVERSV